MKRFWYAIVREGDLLIIYYKLMDEVGVFQIYKTKVKENGNKRINLRRVLMRNNGSIITKVASSSIYSFYVDPYLKKAGWIEVEEKEMLSYLRRGDPDNDARSSLFKFFDRNIFSLTKFELQYFRSSFPNLNRLIDFYRVIKKECKKSGVGYTYRVYNGRSIIITPSKIKKAMMELFEVDPQEVLFTKDDKNNGEKN